MILTTIKERGAGVEPQLRSATYSAATVPVVLPAGLRVEPGIVPDGDGRIGPSTLPFQPRSAAGERMFTRHDGTTFGIELPMDPHFLKQLQPFLHQGASIASGDVDNDGLADLLVVYNARPVLYLNRAGRFEARSIEIGWLESTMVLNGALVDLDGDGWLDLYFGTFGHGAYVVRNDQTGRFTEAAMRKLPTGDDPLSAAVAGFGDVDGDDRLDIVIGRWEFIGRGIRATDRSTPILLLARADSFEVRELPAPRGQPSAMLLTDFDTDGHLDVIVGIDWSPSDQFLRGDGKGGFVAVKRSDGVIPATTLATMTFASADLNNDLAPELYIAGIARYSDRDKAHPRVDPRTICTELEIDARRQECENDMRLRAVFQGAMQKLAIGRCQSIKALDSRGDCVVFAALAQPNAFRAGEVCSVLPETWKQVSTLCTAYRRPTPKHKADDYPEEIPQVDGDNVLLVRGSDGKLADRAKDWGLARAGWTWNARFGDVDNDGFVDLYAANGWYKSEHFESNYFFRNNGGRSFAEETESSGLGSYFPTLAYTYVDLDNDGDLDVISVGPYGPVWVFVNNSQSGNAVTFELRSDRGNAFSIGARLTAYYGEGGTLHQKKELFASGGYLSFDAPVLHFGIGTHDAVTRVEIEWPDGSRSQVAGPFRAGSRYRLNRPG
ncbi:MAG: CRTAC1 family protein [Gemmatimonadales bacterium]